MKKIFVILAAALLSASAASAQKLDALDFDFPFANKIKNKKNDRFDPKLMGIGAIFTDAGSPYDFNPSNSLEFFIYSTDAVRMGNHFEIDYGFGLGWKNLAMTNSSMMTKNNDATITVGNYPAGSIPNSSRVRVFSLSFPVLFSCNIANGFGFSVGPVVNLNVGSKLINKYTVDGDKCKDKIKGAHQNLATVDLMAEINLKEVAIYAKYSPMSNLDKAYWPQFSQWTFGIAF